MMDHLHAPRLPVARYELQFRTQQAFAIAQDKDIRRLWHGVFGAHLRKAACHPHRDECEGCPRIHECDYSYLFTAPRPPDAQRMRRYREIPKPHILQPGHQFPHRFGPEQAFSLQLVLVGDANQRLGVALRALEAAVADGLGSHNGRCRLEHVYSSDNHNALPVEIAHAGQVQPLATPSIPATTACPTSVRVRLISPYKASGQNPRPGELDVGQFLRAILRRVSALQYFYTGEELQAPFRDLSSHSHKIRVPTPDVTTVELPPVRNGNKYKPAVTGLIGQFDLTAEQVKPFWPFLFLGQWLNVGKEASMGFGQYQLHSL